MRYSHIAEHFPFPSLNGRIIFSIRLPVDNSTRKASEIMKHVRPFSGQLRYKELCWCLHILFLLLEELEEFKKLCKLETQFT